MALSLFLSYAFAAGLIGAALAKLLPPLATIRRRMPVLDFLPGWAIRGLAVVEVSVAGLVALHWPLGLAPIWPWTALWLGGLICAGAVLTHLCQRDAVGALPALGLGVLAVSALLLGS